MKKTNLFSSGGWFLGWFWFGWVVMPEAQDATEFVPPQLLTNQEMRLKLTAPKGSNYQINVALDLPVWSPLATLTNSLGTVEYTDSAAPFYPARFYRAQQCADTNVITGDHLVTDNGVVTIHPMNHASFALGGSNITIYVDPTSVVSFKGLPRPDLILITHDHSDHLDQTTLTTFKTTNTVMVAPKAVYQLLSTPLRSQTIILTNGTSTNLLGLEIRAIPAYNLTSSYHVKGVGNGYVLTLGGKNIYISGDTEDIPEMRTLTNIDVAFVCMNLPYTMTVQKAAAIVRQFQPKVVYPYHSRDSDVAKFKQLVGSDLAIEVRLRKWY